VCQASTSIFWHFSPSCKQFAYIQILATVYLLWLLLATEASGQPNLSLLDEEPYDEITLDAENGNALLKVQPLDLPNRTLPADPRPNDSLRIELIEFPGELFDVYYGHITEIVLFESRLLKKARELSRQGKFDVAFEYLRYVESRQADYPGWRDTYAEYLLLHAASDHRLGHDETALSLLDQLDEIKPDQRGLASGFSQVCPSVLKQHIDQGDYAAARALLKRFKNTYGTLTKELVTDWEKRLSQRAEEQLALSEGFSRKQRFGKALQAIDRAKRIWPELPGIDSQARRLDKIYQRIVVGVSKLPSFDFRHRAFDDTSWRRVGRLVELPLFIFSGQGTEGGEYTSPWASVTWDEAHAKLTLEFPPRPLTFPSLSIRVAGSILQSSVFTNAQNPLVKAIEQRGPDRLRLELANRLLPESYLQEIYLQESDPIGSSVLHIGKGTSGPFLLLEQDDQVTRYGRNNPNTSEGGPRLDEILERKFPSITAALGALERGEIDLIDQVPPWYVGKLAKTPSIRLVPYRLPVLHVLLANPNRPFTSNRTFRRGLLYAINRPSILKDVLLEGSVVDGCEVISGPFAPGSGFDDPLRYAIDPQIKPRQYSPRLGKTLALVAARQLAPTSSSTPSKGSESDKTSGEKSDVGDEHTALTALDIPTLHIAHPSNEVARRACEAIREDLAEVGITVQLHELGTQNTSMALKKFDLVYAELAMWEPLVDATRLFGSDGLSGFTSAYLESSIEALREATTWETARVELRRIHRVVHDEVSLIPLWQLVEHLAIPNKSTLPIKRPIHLYDGVESWTMHALNPVVTHSGVLKP